jgi:hypothetical protein
LAVLSLSGCWAAASHGVAGANAVSVHQSQRKAESNPAQGSAKSAPPPAGTAPASGGGSGAAVAAPAPAPTPPPPLEAGWERIDLGAAGIRGFTVDAPAGATAKERFGSAEITQGKSFLLLVARGRANIAQRKKEITANTVNQLKAFTLDSADALLYETEVMGRNFFHFVANVRVAEAAFNCEDSKGAQQWSQADAETMLKACRTIAAATK